MPTCTACNRKEDQIHHCGVCARCCPCSACPICHSVVSYTICSSCGCCKRCCQCYECSKCGQIVNHINLICEYCSCAACCCRHNKAADAAHLLMNHSINLARYYSTHSEHLQRSPLARLLSAEIELCGFKKLTKDNFSALHSVLSNWHCSVVRDGSIGGGIEINTHPAGGDFWVDQITNIMTVAQMAGVYVNSAAGCHVHVNCLDYDYPALARLLRLLACVEAGLYSIIPYSRTHNRYCQFWAMNYLKGVRAAEASIRQNYSKKQQALLYRNAILKLYYGFTSKKDISSVKRSKGNEARYRGVNLHSYLHRGTMEFRMPPGTIYPENIINWGLILGSLVEYAKNSTMERVQADCKEIEAKIFPSQFENCIVHHPWRALSATFINRSFELLTLFAPASAVTDWLHERKKWAKTFTDRTEFIEQS